MSNYAWWDGTPRKKGDVLGDFKSTAQVLKHYNWKKVDEHTWRHPNRPGEHIETTPKGYPGAKGMWYHNKDKDLIPDDPHVRYKDHVRAGRGPTRLHEHLRNLTDNPVRF